ncbi:MAG: hypothetical protein ACUVWR_08730 [Anaerolineae bacterium]
MPRSERVPLRPLQAGDEVWAYLRVSTGEQAERVIPILGQRQAIERYAIATTGELPDTPETRQ